MRAAPRQAAWMLAVIILLFAPLLGGAAARATAEPIEPVLMALVVVLFAGKLGGDIFARWGQPAVLGELLIGVVLGNLQLIGFEALSTLKHDPALQLLAELGVVLLLFSIGLDATVPEMLSVRMSSTLVAVLGVVAPMGL